jgi:hypothetical protein
MMRISGKLLVIIVITLLGCFEGSFAQTQPLHRVFNLRTGDEFVKETVVNSSCMVERGDHKFEIANTTNVSKVYRVNSSTERDYAFIVTITKMDNVIKALGKELQYSSSKPTDPDSKIHKALQYMVDKPLQFTVDKSGTIVSATDQSVELATDTLLAFASIEPEQFIQGTKFLLMADFTPNKSLVKGYNWADSSVAHNRKIVNRFWIEESNDRITSIGFTSAVIDPALNHNLNGIMVIDNATGLVLERVIQGVTVGYQMFKGMVFAATRRYNLTEKCVKKT